MRFCPDEWIADIILDPNDTKEMDRLRDIVESIQWSFTKRLLALGVDVILENGFWSREERFRFRAEAIGAKTKLHFLNVELDELWRRLSECNANLPSGTFLVLRDDLESWAKLFESPTEDEFS